MNGIERFSSAGVAPGKRLDYWNGICSDALSGTTVDSDVTGFRAEMWRWSIGELTLLRPRSDASVVRRAAMGADDLILHLQLKGRSRFACDGHITELGVGDFVLSEAAAGYTFDLSQGHEMLVAEIPRRELTRRIPELDARLCLGLSSLSPGGRVFRDFLLTLWRQTGEEEAPAPEAEFETGLTDAFCDLCALAVKGAAHPQQARSGPVISGLLRRCEAYIDAHLGDPALGTNRLAEEFGISLRTLQGAFATAGKTPTAHILERRLAAAADRLRAEPARSVTEIAFAHGFNDSAYFSRCFRRRFGLSPREWRHTA